MPDTIFSVDKFKELADRIKELHDDQYQLDDACVTPLCNFITLYNRMLRNREAICEDRHICPCHSQAVENATAQQNRKEKIIEIAEELKAYFQKSEPRCLKIKNMLKTI